MKKIIYCYLLFFSSSFVLASNSRLQSLGFMGHNFILDSYNIWLYPSTIVNYNNNFFMESSFPSYYNGGGVILPLTSQFNFGAFLTNEEKSIEYSDTQIEENGNLIDNNDADQKLDLFAGIQTRYVNYGFHFNAYSRYTQYSYQSSSELNFSSSLWSYSLGGGITVKPNDKNRIDLGFLFTFRGYEYKLQSRTVPKYLEPDGHNALDISIRYFGSITKKLVVVPFFQYNYDGAGFENLIYNSNASGIQSLLQKKKTIAGGIGFDSMPREHVLINLALGIYHSNIEYDVEHNLNYSSLPDTNATVLPFFNLGMEAELYKWLGLRLSYYKLFLTINGNRPINSTMSDEISIDRNIYGANIGLYVKLNQLKIDIMFGNNSGLQQYQNGTYWTTSIDKSNNIMLKQVSLIYSF